MYKIVVHQIYALFPFFEHLIYRSLQCFFSQIFWTPFYVYLFSHRPAPPDFLRFHSLWHVFFLHFVATEDSMSPGPRIFSLLRLQNLATPSTDLQRCSGGIGKSIRNPVRAPGAWKMPHAFLAVNFFPLGRILFFFSVLSDAPLFALNRPPFKIFVDQTTTHPTQKCEPGFCRHPSHSPFLRRTAFC